MVEAAGTHHQYFCVVTLIWLEIYLVPGIVLGLSGAIVEIEQKERADQ